MHTHVNLDALLSQVSQRLDPNSIAVDGRDARDRMAFISQMSHLIQFYDQQNQPCGSWQPILLKDPAILLAVISKTDYQTLYLKFQQIRKQLNQKQLKATLARENSDITPALIQQLKTSVVPFFELLDTMFEDINRWVAAMSQSDASYRLKQFVLQHVSGQLSSQLQQRCGIQNYLAREFSGVVAPFDTKRLTKLAYIKGIKEALAEGRMDLNATSERLEQLFQRVFSFFVEVITSAEKGFGQQYEARHNYPDTALIRVFSQLLDYAQAGLNEFSEKHLAFYYNRLLAQRQRLAQPDTTYIRIDLDKKIPSYTLAGDTAFLAGQYADNSNVLFATQRSAELNHIEFGQLISTNYLSFTKGSPKQQTYHYLNAVNQLRYSQTGQPLCQSILSNQAMTPAQQGFAMASAMLELAEGTRIIKLQLTLDQAIDIATLESSTITLSTAKGWANVSEPSWQQIDEQEPTEETDPKATVETTSVSYALSLRLDEDFPAVAAFAKPPAGFASLLPYCQITLPAQANLQVIPRLLSLDIDVQVFGSSKAELYQNGALLVAGKPMPIFGATPEVGSVCDIQYAECFNKPLTSLDVTLEWEPLPAEGFTQYYEAYNCYLDDQGQKEAKFSNSAFTTDWQIHHDTTWQSIDATLSAQAPIAPLLDEEESPSEPTPEPKKRGFFSRLFSWHHDAEQSDRADITQPTKGLFAQQSEGSNAPLSNFHFTFATPSTNSGTGPSLRMALTGPKYAFGNPIYPALVADISLKNAKKLITGASLLGLVALVMKLFTIVAKVISGLLELITYVLPFLKKHQSKSSYIGELTPMPNLPFVPKVKRVSTAYTAQCHYDFSQTQNNDMDGAGFEWLHIGAFTTYRYFAVANGQISTDLSHVRVQPTQATNQAGLALFEGASQADCNLYIELNDVSTPCLVNLFIQLATNSDENQAPVALTLYYWGESGWSMATVIDDSTKGLLCSGIVTLDLPDDVVLNAPRFAVQPNAPKQDAPKQDTSQPPQNNAWLMLTQSGPRTIDILYMNTQVIKVQRETPIALPQGECPIIAANTIKGLQTANPALAKVSQPFASTGGVAAEDQNAFLGRVSQRIRDKDRVYSSLDYTVLAKQAYSAVFYVKNLPSATSGRVRLGVVRRYSSINDANALRPVIGATEREGIYSYLSCRTSPMAQVRVENLEHEAVQVTATLIVSQSANLTELKAQLSNGINLYLAPWISADQPQYDITRGISQAGLSSYLASFEQVVGIQQLQLSKLASQLVSDAHDETDMPVLNDDSDWVIPSLENQILVPAHSHTLNFIRVSNEAHTEALYG